jgi:hypothetical protein
MSSTKDTKKSRGEKRFVKQQRNSGEKRSVSLGTEKAKKAHLPLTKNPATMARVKKIDPIFHVFTIERLL